MFLALLSSNANATYEIEGDYSGHGEGDLSMRIIVLDNEKGIVAVSASTGTGGCSGTIAGVGNYIGNTLKFGNYTKEEGAENCMVNVTFKDGKKGKKVGEISEENCSYFHGAACAFDGNILKNK